MITNAAKHDVDESSLVQEIQQLGLPRENSENIGRAYREQKDALRSRFAEESYQISHLLSSSWRVDQVVSSSSMSSQEPISTLVHLKFVLDTRPQDGAIVESSVPDGRRVKEFACELTSDKLDVLIFELSKGHALLQQFQA